MARVFDPLVFQPSVFQVGTLDVVTPDVATKRRKWLSLSVPRSGRVSGATVFAVSRDSAGILIGVRDKAAPQFAVSRDAEGLLLSAWPASPPGIPPSVRSYATSIASNANPRLVSRPDGLAIGDLMVLAAFMYAGLPSSGPDGFTKILDPAVGLTVPVWTKVADSADVAVSNFSVGNTDREKMGLVLYAVKDAGPVEYSAVIHRTGDAFPTGFTPSAAGDVFLAFVSAAGFGVNPVARTVYNDPVWTQDFADVSWGAYYSSHASYGVGTTGTISSPKLNTTQGGFAFVAVGSA